MADFKLYFPLEEKFEGTAFENVAGDSGGATKFGLTVDDLHEFGVDYTGDHIIDWHDVQALTAPNASLILKKLYWDFMQADYITNQSLAEYIVDSGLNQGRILIAKYVQTILNVTADGHFGSVTISCINKANQADLFKQLHDRRMQRYNAIVAGNPSQAKFIKGWTNRCNAITFKP